MESQGRLFVITVLLLGIIYEKWVKQVIQFETNNAEFLENTQIHLIERNWK